MRKISFWQVFRIIFTFFSLYIISDAFYRWDGFSYYASLSEFIQSFSLLLILWSIIALIFSIFAWVALKMLEWLCKHTGWKIYADHLLLFLVLSIIVEILVWSSKRFMWPNMPVHIAIKAMVVCSSIFVAAFLAFLLRNNAEKWVENIKSNITPIVWLFGIFVFLSIPLVAYRTLGHNEQPGKPQTALEQEKADKTRPNIILVTFDALTARDMSVYGYTKQTTPFISEWAKTASLFMKAEAESNSTTSTTASLMTGKRLWTHQTYHIMGSKPDKSNVESLPLLLKNNGYQTMSFVANPVASVEILGVSNAFDIKPPANEFVDTTFWFAGGDMVNFGFADIFLYKIFGGKFRLHDWIIRSDFILGKQLSLTFPRDLKKSTVPPKKAFNKFISALKSDSKDPYFAWIHLLPPHDPYLPPESYKGMFGSSSGLRTREKYDEFIRYCDKEFENFISSLQEKTGIDNTIIILSADHGESFEHNYIGHSTSHLYEQVTHIPLIIKEPNQSNGRIIPDLVEQIDIPATILDFAGISVPSWMEGRSLVPLVNGDKLPEKIAFSMNFQNNRSRGHIIETGGIAVWKGNYKLVHYLDENRSLLFDLQQDPGEINDLFDLEPVIAEDLLSLIQINLKRANEKNTKSK